MIYDVIPQAALSAPETREEQPPVLCTFCNSRVPMCDRQVSGAMHPTCRKVSGAATMSLPPGSGVVITGLPVMKNGDSVVVRTTRVITS